MAYFTVPWRSICFLVVPNWVCCTEAANDDTMIVLCSCGIPAQERFILDIIARSSLHASNGITKATATKQSGNWYRWCTFPKNSGITEEFLGGIPQEQMRILLSSFAASVRQNQLGTTSKCILQKGDISFYRKHRELSHGIGILHLADKVSPTFRTQKNGVKNTTVTQ